MLEVEINKILPLTEARDNFSKIVGEVEGGELYVLTKNGKPAVAIINVAKLEKMTGQRLKETSKPVPEPSLITSDLPPIFPPSESPASVPPPKSSYTPNPPPATSPPSHPPTPTPSTPSTTPPGPPPLDSAQGKPLGEHSDKSKPASPSVPPEPEEMEI